MGTPTFRTIMLRTFKAAQRALRVVDVSEENTEIVASNEVTVSTTLLHIEDFFSIELTGDEIAMRIQVIAGGPININAALETVAAADGSDGSLQFNSGDTAIITGPNDIARMSAILDSSGVAATVRANLTRRTK